jgi:hypothetical protein
MCPLTAGVCCTGLKYGLKPRCSLDRMNIATVEESNQLSVSANFKTLERQIQYSLLSFCSLLLHHKMYKIWSHLHVEQRGEAVLLLLKIRRRHCTVSLCDVTGCASATASDQFHCVLMAIIIIYHSTDEYPI